MEGIWLPFERYLLETTKKATLPWLPFECYLLETTKKSLCLKTCKLPFERYLLKATKKALCRKTGYREATYLEKGVKFVRSQSKKSLQHLRENR